MSDDDEGEPTQLFLFFSDVEPRFKEKPWEENVVRLMGTCPPRDDHESLQSKMVTSCENTA
jgi:hypothetical protein